MSSIISLRISFVVSVAWCSKVAHSLRRSYTSFLLSLSILLASLVFLCTKKSQFEAATTYVESVDSVLDRQLVCFEVSFLAENVHDIGEGLVKFGVVVHL